MPTARPRSGAGAAADGVAAKAARAAAGTARPPAPHRPGPRTVRGGGQGRGPVQYVDAGELGDVDVDGTALLDSLDDETLQRRRGTSRKGRPAGRYLMVVHVAPGRLRAHRCARGPPADRALHLDPDRREHVDRRQHLSRARAERAARHGSRVHRHRHAQERRAVPRRRRVRRERRRGRREAAHRARAPQRPGDHRAGHEEPDRAQGRPPHPGSEPRGPLRGDGPGSAPDVRHLEAPARRRAQAAAARARPSAPGRRGAHRPHRGRRRDRRRARARHAAPQRAVAADLGDREEGEGRAASSTRSRSSRSASSARSSRRSSAASSSTTARCTKK